MPLGSKGVHHLRFACASSNVRGKETLAEQAQEIVRVLGVSDTSLRPRNLSAVEAGSMLGYMHERVMLMLMLM